MERKPTEKGKRSFGDGIRDILQGKILDHPVIRRNPKFIIMIAVMGMIMILRSYAFEKAIIRHRHNESVINNLKADHSNKKAVLLYRSKRGEIEKKLMDKGSEVRKPVEPARIVETEK